MIEIIHGNAFTAMQTLPAESIDTIITSPPYYKCRDYGVEGQIGQELTKEAYIQKLFTLFSLANRPLKRTGSLWVNIGDRKNNGSWSFIPEDFAKRMVEHGGWKCVNKVIWRKTDPMPSSTKRGLTPTYEYLYHFVRRKDYYYDLEAIKVPKLYPARGQKFGGNKHKGYGNATYSGKPYISDNPNKNPGDVWDIATAKSKLPHYAVFPEELVKRPLLATCPPGGTVLDPFCGIGTTLLVADKLGRNGIGIELSEDFCEIAVENLGNMGIDVNYSRI